MNEYITPPRDWNSAVKCALMALDNHAPQLGLVPPEVSMHNIEWAVNEGKTKASSYLPTFKDAAKHVMHDMPEQDMLDLPALLLSRHMKYGKGNIATFEYIGIGVRMHDKLSRLTHANKDVNFTDETVADTRMDVVGYTVIAIMVEKQWWNLPVQAPLF